MRLSALAVFAVLAPMFAAPCVAANQAYFYSWCSRQLNGTTSVQTYVAIQTGSSPNPGPGGDVSAPVQTSLTGKSCIYAQQQGISPLKAYPLSNPVVKKLLGSAQIARRGGGAAHGAAVTTSQQDTFGWLVPLPFDPPVKIPSTATSGSCDGSLSVYMVEHDTSRVEDLTLCPLASVATIMPCAEPLEQALTPDGSTLLVTCYDNQVVWIDTATDTVTFTLSGLNAYPAGIAISPDGSLAYVTNYFDSDPNPALLVIDVANKMLLQTIPLPRAYPGVVALTPDGSQAWVNYYQGPGVDVIDTLTGMYVGGINFDADTENAIAFNSTGTKAFISILGTNQLAIVDTGTLRTIAMVDVGTAPDDVIYNPQEQTVLVGSSTQGVVSQVDAVTNTFIQNFTVNAGGIGLSLALGNLPFP